MIFAGLYATSARKKHNHQDIGAHMSTRQARARSSLPPALYAIMPAAYPYNAPGAFILETETMEELYVQIPGSSKKCVP